MSLILSGTDGLSDVDGSAATPAIRGTDANTGIFFGADIIGFAEGGAEVARFNADAQFVAAAGTASLPVITTTGDVNTGIFFPAADTIAFSTAGTERGRITSTGELTYTKSTLASYVWTGFQPTNVTGTLTNAPATGTIYDTNYVTMVNSSGTVTTTFDIAGSYLITICVDTKHAFAYTFERTNFNLGGTATRTSPVNQIVFNGVDSVDADTSASISFLVIATAGQTITVLPTYELTGSGTVASHNCYPYITTMYCGG
jgi:hypothetical protein